MIGSNKIRLCLLCWSMDAIVVMHQETLGPQWWDSTLYSDHARMLCTKPEEHSEC